HDSVSVRSNLRHSFAPPDSKIRLGVIYHRTGRGTLTWGLPADGGITRIEIIPFADMVPNFIRHNCIFLYRDLPVQKRDIHQNPSFRLPNRSARSVRFKAWWSASSRCS